MTIKTAMRATALGLALASLLAIDVAPGTWSGVTFVRDVQAIVGAPVTPVSYAGVARRTTRRAVVATSSATAAAASSQQAAAAQQQQAVAQQQAATAQQQAATAKQQEAVAQQQAAVAQQQAAGLPASGTIVPTLPTGCVGTAKSGVEYYKCGDVTYRVAFQGNNIVYVVQ